MLYHIYLNVSPMLSIYHDSYELYMNDISAIKLYN